MLVKLSLKIQRGPKRSEPEIWANAGMGQAFASLVRQIVLESLLVDSAPATVPKVTGFDTVREGKMRAIGGFQASYRHSAEH